jgi:CBS domain-containing protein
MSKDDLKICTESATCQQAAKIMADGLVGALPVVDSSGLLCGIITDRDICCRCVAEGRGYDTPVREFMSTDVKTCSPDTSLRDVETLMRRFEIRRLPVVDEANKIIGIISLSDVVAAIHDRKEEHELKEVLDVVCSPQRQPV